MSRRKKRVKKKGGKKKGAKHDQFRNQHGPKKTRRVVKKRTRRVVKEVFARQKIELLCVVCGGVWCGVWCGVWGGVCVCVSRN